MKRGIQRRLALLLIVLAILGLTLTDRVLSASIREEMVGQRAAQLALATEVVLHEMRERPSQERAMGYQAAAQHLAEELGLGVMLLAADGRVLGDSVSRLGELPVPARLAQEPDVRAAMDAGRGQAVVAHPEVGETLAVSRRVDPPLGEIAIVRVLANLTAIEAVIQRLHRTVFWLILFAVVAAWWLSALIASRLQERLDALVAAAETLAAGAPAAKPHLARDAMLGEIGESMERASQAVRDQVAMLQEERDLLSVILESMGEGVMVVAPEGGILLTNPAFRRMMDVDLDVLGRTPIEALRVPEIAELCERARRTQTAQMRDIEWAGPETRRWMVQCTPLPDRGGLVCVVYDVTELRRLEQVRRDFVANVSHELRTPITAIRGYAETLLSGTAGDPEAARNFIETIHRHAERLSALISDLLDLSRIEAGAVTLNAEVLGVREIVEHALAGVEATAQKKTVAVDIAQLRADVRVRGDARALEQVVANLLDNAVKYTPAGGRVTVEAGADNGHVRLIVSDTGPGIAPQHRDRIFERFYRVDPARSRALGGTGLGLSIVRHLTEAMGGKVGLECPPGGGSRFWVRLPAA